MNFVLQMCHLYHVHLCICTCDQVVLDSLYLQPWLEIWMGIRTNFSTLVTRLEIKCFILSAWLPPVGNLNVLRLFAVYCSEQITNSVALALLWTVSGIDIRKHGLEKLLEIDRISISYTSDRSYPALWLVCAVVCVANYFFRFWQWNFGHLLITK